MAELRRYVGKDVSPKVVWQRDSVAICTYVGKVPTGDLNLMRDVFEGEKSLQQRRRELTSVRAVGVHPVGPSKFFNVVVADFLLEGLQLLMEIFLRLLAVLSAPTACGRVPG